MQNPTGFVVKGRLFQTPEQYLWYKRALLFNDLEAAQNILKLTTLTDQKRVGKQVKDVDEYRWNKYRLVYLHEAFRARFAQRPEFLETLIATRGTTIVYAHPTDRTWGIGQGVNSEEKFDRAQWRGPNRLGDVLTQLREDLYSSLQTSKWLNDALNVVLRRIQAGEDPPADTAAFTATLQAALRSVTPEYEQTGVDQYTVEPAEEGARVFHLRHTTGELTYNYPMDALYFPPNPESKQHLMMDYWRSLGRVEDEVYNHAEIRKAYHVALTSDPFYADGRTDAPLAYATQRTAGRVTGQVLPAAEDEQPAVVLRSSYDMNAWQERDGWFFLVHQVYPVAQLA